MKKHTSMKICKLYSNCFRVGYCDLQNIFFGVDPVYYNSGVYGWNNDLYVDYMTDSIFTTGYRNMRGKQINHDIIKKYDTIARDIIENHSFKDYDSMMEKLTENRTDFIKAVLAGV